MRAPRTRFQPLRLGDNVYIICEAAIIKEKRTLVFHDDITAVPVIASKQELMTKALFPIISNVARSLEVKVQQITTTEEAAETKD
ncbi:hypothetical protein AURDEDRAFT_166661 [Auricularia subglabra TFB-10046 SS5]|nr:hypothetical protein AURDEDRAFT_166661 [Auricularia subglabra TFB-10046 SS5]